MKRALITLAALLLGNFALAAPSTYAEFAYIEGGENGENGTGEQDGYEFAGSFAFSDNWYIGGALGSYDRGSIENDYININGGKTFGMTPSTDFITEIGLWFGEEDGPGYKRDPKSLEVKLGASTAITDAFSIFGTISLVSGDLDRPGSDDLTNFVWSAGGAYAFTPNFSLSLKIVEGSNGVNGQSDIARIGARWTF